jgi:PAS domain S-box-containing protein/diguanylate cyclase (GGDEF)-like protein
MGHSGDAQLRALFINAAVGAGLSGILLVERSTTLSHLVRRTLAATALPVRTEIGNYLDACEHLRRIGEIDSAGTPYSVAILGAPARPTREFIALLDYVRNAPEAPPTLLLAHEETSEIRAWVQGTLRGRFLLWSQFSRIPAAVLELAPDEVASAEQSKADRLRILFVDDSQSVRQAYSQLLERNGYAVEVAGSIAEADAMAAESAYDLVVVDYFLPDGSGDELCRRLSTMPDPPVLSVITGSYREDIIKRCLQAGASECMFKNEARELFLTRIRTLARTIEMRKSAETERQQLDGILGSVGDGVFGVDADGRISFVNPKGLRLLGYTDEADLVGLLAQATVHPHESTRGPQLARAYSDATPLPLAETMFRRRDGSGVPVECTVLPLAAPRRKQGAVVVFRDIAERRTAERLRWELSHDPLTGLPNARHLRQRLIAELARLRERGGYAALLHIEVGRDDEQISPRGDEMLRTVAHALARRLREGDVLARGEGDSFLLLLHGVHLDHMPALIKSFHELLDGRTYTIGDNQHMIAVGIGAELLSPQTVIADEVLERVRQASQRERGVADSALSGESMDGKAAILSPSERLRLALEQARFVILIQPVMALRGVGAGRELPAENPGWQVRRDDETPLFAVLLRMVGKDGQLILPRAFIPLAERVGMIQRLDLWVINGLLAHLAATRTNAVEFGLIARLSPATVADPESLEAIERAIIKSAVPASRLVLEIRNSPELANLPAARRFIARLQAIGCRFVLNGSESSARAVSSVQSQHVSGDFVRLDRQVVNRLVADERAKILLASIVNLAQSVEKRVIAGEIEDDATLDALREAGVDYAQGPRIGEARLLKRVDFAGLLAQK